ncbi:hypothetical protein, partial [Acinetobacter baumannii]|uniref:hypothetical protein n=1 Tax=Acinetobacter baumannii TaxID=470 RepID=UPI001BB46F1B
SCVLILLVLESRPKPRSKINYVDVSLVPLSSLDVCRKYQADQCFFLFNSGEDQSFNQGLSTAASKL